MISLEQVKLLEEKVSKAIEYVQKVNEENAALISEKASLISKLEANKKRIDELEVHVLEFKEDQSRIEDGIIAALNRLSQFEEAFEKSLKEPGKTKEKNAAPKKIEPVKTEPEKMESNEVYFEIDDKSDSEEELDIF